MKFSIICSPLIAASLATSSFGSVLASWDTTGASGASPFAATTTAVKIGSASISLGTVNPLSSGITDAFGFSEIRKITFVGAALFGDYLEVNIQANPGLFLNLTSIDLNLTSPDSGGQRPRFFSDIAVLASTDGFQSIGNTTLVTASSISNAGEQFFNAPIALSGGPFGGTENELDFRVYAWGNPSIFYNSSDLVLSNDGGDNALTITGATIPEISAAFPLGLLLSFSVMGNRRRKHK